MTRLKHVLMFLCSGTVAALAAVSEVHNHAFELPQIRHEHHATPDKPLATHQQELLEIAFESVSAMPVDPHIKDRSRCQQLVVTACLELDQAGRAVEYINRIENWRRGLAAADLAHHCVERKKNHSVAEVLKVAEKIASKADLADWRRDRIRVRIAQTYALLGQGAQSQKFGADLVDSEVGKVASSKVVGGAESFDEQLKVLDDLATSKSFDTLRNVVAGYTQLHRRFYSDAERRNPLRDRIVELIAKLPPFIQIESRLDMAEAALNHGDPSTALVLVEEAHDVLKQHEWPQRYRLPLAARIATLRFQAGDEAPARELLEEAISTFQKHIKTVLNFERTEALCPVAEAYQAMGDAEAARAIYKFALEQAALNPNARPRAEDLSTICCSMAQHDVDPGTALMNKIRQINQGLEQPW